MYTVKLCYSEEKEEIFPAVDVTVSRLYAKNYDEYADMIEKRPTRCPQVHNAPSINGKGFTFTEIIIREPNGLLSWHYVHYAEIFVMNESGQTVMKRIA
ncbi:MAG: hypothetical protein ACTSQY_10850 [Candidatus Odinarchaeia archaeon]